MKIRLVRAARETFKTGHILITANAVSVSSNPKKLRYKQMETSNIHPQISLILLNVDFFALLALKEGLLNTMTYCKNCMRVYYYNWKGNLEL